MFIQRILSTDNKKNQNFKAANMTEVKKLTNEISKRIYGKKGAMDVYRNFPLAEGISMGTTGLPESWFKKIKDLSQFDLPSFCEKLGKIFTEDRHFSNIDSMNKSLRILFGTFGLIDKDDTFKVTYLEKGFFGRAYKVDLNDGQPKVIKEYKRTYRYQNNHGNYAEQNIAEYIDRFSGKNTNMAKYYYGDANNGIMILDFISKDTPTPEKIVELDELGLAYDDNKPRNLVNDYIIDYGGIITVSNLVGNKVAQDIYRQFKYMEDNDAKRELFNKILYDTTNMDCISNLIGLTHSIKFFPTSEQPDLYRQMNKFHLSEIKIALVENIKNFDISFRDNEIVRELAETKDPFVKEVIAREIKHFPSDLTHSLMEKYSTEENNTIKKYLARNLNFYYKNREKRYQIYDNLMVNADTYANIALVNALDKIPLAERDKKFAQFMDLGDIVVDCALARNIEVFNDREDLMKKWVDKLMTINDVRVKRALCESVRFMPEKLMKESFVKLLDVQDMNAKEFLAESLTSIPYYHSYPEWFDQIYEASGNSVKRELAKALANVNTPNLKTKWAKQLYQNGDSSVKAILEKQGLKFD